MAIPTTRDELKHYCLRKLGQPVLRINVDDTQLEDAIDDALSLFFQYHYDGQLDQYLLHQLTQSEIDTGVIILDDNVYSVSNVKLISSSASSVSSNLNDMQVVSFFTDVISKAIGASGGGSGVSNYYTMNAKLAEINQAFKVHTIETFNLSRGRVYIHSFLSAKAGDVVIMFCTLRTTPEEFPKVWNNQWLKDYLTQLFRLQWYTNLSKYSGVQLVGGVTLDAQQQISDANEKIDMLRVQLRTDFELPPMFFMG